MTIPFLSYFKRSKAAVKEPAAAPVVPPLEKPSNERFSKTVMPNATRTLPPQDPFEMAARSTALGGQMPSVAIPGTPRTISFSPGSQAASAQRDLPPAIALALAPQVERVISLELGDVIAEMMPSYIKPVAAIDTTRRILVKATEVEKGMARGKPTVSLATIYQQVPEIFVRKISDSDESQLPLPPQKVLAAFERLQVRGDQEQHLVVPQVETPFLKVAVEDSSEFGTPIEPLEMNIGPLPSVRIQPPTAAAFAAAEPEEVFEAVRKMAPPPAPNGTTPRTPTRIPFKLSPNGTDAPAPESVPASSGPSVPNLLPSPLAPVSPGAGIDDPAAGQDPGSTIPATTGSAMPATKPPVRIPFKMIPVTSAPIEEETKPKPEPWLTKDSLAASTETPVEPQMATPVISEPARPAEVKIALPLLPILKSLPPLQLTGDPSCVPADVRLELPFALIEPQLASGRVSVTAKVFEVSMPISFRGLFQAGQGAVDVVLPLQEVLKNLPATSLRMRDDQEEQEAGQNFATPFSAKAEEDAKRFNVSTTPVSKPATPEPEAKPEPVVAEVSPAPEGAGTPAAPEEKKPADAAPEDKAQESSGDRPLRTPLQVALGTDEKLDAKGVVALVKKIQGVKACAIHFGDGLSLAGSLPAELETEGLCAMAPSLMQRIENHLVDTKLGPLRGMTLSSTKGAITFFMHENLCLAALHADVDLPGETREKLSRIVHELSRKYSHPV
jgi:predicted regulator of Ras-like GTPase activity (Roadblock/LC7/MglB family)